MSDERTPQLEQQSQQAFDKDKKRKSWLQRLRRAFPALVLGTTLSVAPDAGRPQNTRVETDPVPAGTPTAVGAETPSSSPTTTSEFRTPPQYPESSAYSITIEGAPLQPVKSQEDPEPQLAPLPPETREIPRAAMQENEIPMPAMNNEPRQVVPNWIIQELNQSQAPIEVVPVAPEVQEVPAGFTQIEDTWVDPSGKENQIVRFYLKNAEGQMQFLQTTLDQVQYADGAAVTFTDISGKALAIQYDANTGSSFEISPERGLPMMEIGQVTIAR